MRVVDSNKPINSSGGPRIFPRLERKPPPPPAVGGRGALEPTYDFARISQKLHEIERIWTEGTRSKFYYVYPPLKSYLTGA